VRGAAGRDLGQLGRRAAHRDHRRADLARHVDGGQASSASGAEDQHGLAGAQPAPRDQAVVRGLVVAEQAARLIEGQRARDRDRGRGRRHRVGREAAPALVRAERSRAGGEAVDQHAIADGAGGDRRAAPRDLAGVLEAGRVRRLRHVLVLATHHDQVDPADLRRRDADDHVGRRERRRIGRRLRRQVGVVVEGVHGRLAQRGDDDVVAGLHRRALCQ
jgi:hypothetical protein